MALTPEEITIVANELKTSIAPVYPIYETKDCMDLLNDPANNLGGEQTNTRLTVGLFVENAVVDDITSQSIGDGAQLIMRSILAQDFYTDIEHLKPKILSFLKANTATEANLAALMRPMSRLEVLVGVGKAIGKEDFRAARNLATTGA